MKVINKLESYPTGDMIVPYCPNCDSPTYSERKCPFCNTELEYEEIIEEDKKIRKIKLCYSPDIDEEIFYEDGDKPNHCILGDAGTKLLINKINEIIDYLEEK